MPKVFSTYALASVRAFFVWIVMIPHVGYKNDKRCRCRHLIASFAWVEDGIGYYADRSAPFNAFPLCLPQGHYQAALCNKLPCNIFCPPYNPMYASI